MGYWLGYHAKAQESSPTCVAGLCSSLNHENLQRGARSRPFDEGLTGTIRRPWPVGVNQAI